MPWVLEIRAPPPLTAEATRNDPSPDPEKDAQESGCGFVGKAPARGSGLGAGTPATGEGVAVQRRRITAGVGRTSMGWAVAAA